MTDFFGVTRDPTSNYTFIMRYCESKDLYSYLDETQGMLDWKDIVEMLWQISSGIEYIHES
jgi:serine/threonine protein kinase